MRYETLKKVVNVDCGLLGNNATATTCKTTWCYTAENHVLNTAFVLIHCEKIKNMSNGEECCKMTLSLAKIVQCWKWMNEIRVWSLGGMIPTGGNQNSQKKYLSQSHFVHQKSHAYWPGFYGE